MSSSLLTKSESSTDLLLLPPTRRTNNKFMIALIYFTIWKVTTVTVLIMMALDLFTEPPVEERFLVDVTPIEGNPHNKGVFYNVLIGTHALMAVLVTFVAAVILMMTKGTARHKSIGTVFFVAWMLHMVVGMVAALMKMIQNGFHEEAYIASPTSRGFTLHLYVQFSFYVPCISDSFISAFASIEYREAQSRPGSLMLSFLKLSTVPTILHGAILWSFWMRALCDPSSTSESARKFAILGTVEIPLFLFYIVKNHIYWRNYIRNSSYSTAEWKLVHQRNMCVIVTITFVTMVGNIAYVSTPLDSPLVAILWVLTEILCFSMNWYLSRKVTEEKARSSLFSRISEAVSPLLSLLALPKSSTCGNVQASYTPYRFGDPRGRLHHQIAPLITTPSGSTRSLQRRRSSAGDGYETPEAKGFYVFCASTKSYPAFGVQLPIPRVTSMD